MGTARQAQTWNSRSLSNPSLVLATVARRLPHLTKEMLSHGALNRRHTISASAAAGAGLYNGYGMAVERSSRSDGLWCSPGYDAPASYAKDKKLRKKHRLDLSDPWCILAIAGLLVFAWAMHGRAQRAWILKELHVQTLEEALQTFRSIQEQHHMAEEDLEHQYAIAERLQKRDRAWKEQAEWLQNATKKESHRAVVDKYVCPCKTLGVVVGSAVLTVAACLPSLYLAAGSDRVRTWFR
jgi:hypothetical protein